MNRRSCVLWLIALAGVGLLAAASWSFAADAKPAGDIDFGRAKQLLDKQRNGQTLTADEDAYLNRAKEARRGGKGGQKPGAPAGRSQKPTPPLPKDHLGLIPFDQATAQDNYKGEDGGLYGGGKNVPPPAHQQAAEKELAKIVPLGPDGKPAPDGKIVLLSIGMSNTTQEFSKFTEIADGDPAKSPQVVLVDGAQGGQDAARWNTADAATWTHVAERLKKAGVTPAQVQVVWMKHARISPAQYGDFPKHAEELKGHTLTSLNLARQKFPNLRIVYMSNRIYAGYATSGLNPEPYSYESAFVIRWLIRDQIKGEPSLNYDPAKGEVKAPLLLWGPYLWADGITPRKSDGLVWLREDLREDGTHPSTTSGRAKVAKLLLKFFKTDPNAKGWFCKAGTRA
jgi:hypothetical protein